MENKSKGPIHVKVLCIIKHNGKILASKGFDEVKNEAFYRLMGGSLHSGETTEQGMRREVREEVGVEAQSLRLLDVVENIYTYLGKPGHQIVFLYEADLGDSEVYNKEIIHVVEEDYEFDAVWVPVKDVLEERVRLYPKYDYSKVL